LLPLVELFLEQSGQLLVLFLLHGFLLKSLLLFLVFMLLLYLLVLLFDFDEGIYFVLDIVLEQVHIFTCGLNTSDIDVI
jgi:hypothetical protein